MIAVHLALLSVQLAFASGAIVGKWVLNEEHVDPTALALTRAVGTALTLQLLAFFSARPTSHVSLPAAGRGTDRKTRDFALDPKTRDFALDPKTRDFALDPKTRDFALDPKTRDFALDPKTRDFALDPKTRDFALDPKTRDFALDPKTRDFALDPKTRDFALDPKTRDFALDPKTRDFALDPKTRDFALDPKTRDFALDPKTRDFALDPKTRDFALDPKTRDFALDPKTRDFALDPKTRDFALDPKTRDFALDPKTRDFALDPKTRDFALDPLTLRVHAQIAGLSVLGVIINQVFFLQGLKRGTASSAALLGATIPVFTVLVALALGREKPSRRAVAGISVASLGVLTLTGVSQLHVGNLLVTINSLSYAAYLVLAGSVLKRHGTLRVMAWVFTYGAIGLCFLGLPALLSGVLTWSARGRWLVAYFVLVPTLFAYLANAYALTRAPASLVATYIYLQPLLVLAFAGKLLGESWTVRLLVSAAAIFLGLSLVVTRARTQFEPGRPPR